MFGATAPLLDDPAENLLAVSAFNDNGLKSLVDERESATSRHQLSAVTNNSRRYSVQQSAGVHYKPIGKLY